MATEEIINKTSGIMKKVMKALNGESTVLSYTVLSLFQKYYENLVRDLDENLFKSAHKDLTDRVKIESFRKLMESMKKVEK